MSAEAAAAMFGHVLGCRNHGKTPTQEYSDAVLTTSYKVLTVWRGEAEGRREGAAEGEDHTKPSIADYAIKIIQFIT